MTFCALSLQALAPIIPLAKQQHRVWICFKQHMQYIKLLLQTSFSRDDITRLDQLIFNSQSLFLEIPQYFCLWKPKNHFAQHFPVDIMRYGPPSYFWTLKFEMRHQLLKRIAKASNYVSLVHTVVYTMDMNTALCLSSGEHLLFNQVSVVAGPSEICVAGSNDIIDQLYASGVLHPSQAVAITWGVAVNLSRERQVYRGSWAIFTFAAEGEGNDVSYLVKICTFFTISGIIMVNYQPIPFKELARDDLRCAWSLLSSAIQQPTLPPVSTAIQNLQGLKVLQNYAVDDVLYFEE